MALYPPTKTIVTIVSPSPKSMRKLGKRIRLRRAMLAALLAPSTTLVAAQTLQAVNVSAVTTLAPVNVLAGPTAAQASIVGVGDVPLARSPVSAVVITAQDVQANGAKRLADLLKLDASVSDAYNAQGYWDYATVRGYVLDNKANYRRDGLPISAETFIPLENKEQVEILKGTSGMQIGTSAPGGLVNYSLKRPTENSLRSLKLEAGNNGGTLAAMDLGNRFGTDKAFGYRLNAVYEDIHSYTPHANGQRSLLSLAMDWRLNRNTLVEAEAEYSHRSQPSVPGLSLLGNALPNPDPRLNINNQSWSQPVDLRSVTGSLRVEQSINDQWRWSAQLATQQLRSQDRIAFPFGCTDNSGAYYADRFCPNGDFDLYDYRSENERRSTKAAQLQVKGQFQTDWVAHDITIGALASRRQDQFNMAAYNYVGTSNLQNLAPLAPAPDLSTQNTNRNERSTELSAVDAMHWSANLTTWLGLRYTQLHRDSVQTDGSQAIGYQQNFATPWFALGYKIDPAVMAYASYGQGIESEIAPNLSRYSNAGQVLPALRSRQIEIGLKGSSENSMQGLRWQATLYDIRRPLYTDMGSCDSDNSCQRMADGIDHHRGMELRADWQRNNLTLGTGISVIDAKREASVRAATLNNLRPTNVPSWILRMHAAYRLPQIQGLSIEGNLSHEGKRNVLPDASVQLPGWTRLDAALRYQTKIWGTNTHWGLAVNNVLGKQYFQESPYQFAHAYLFPAAPRTIRMTLEAAL